MQNLLGIYSHHRRNLFLSPEKLIMDASISSAHKNKNTDRAGNLSLSEIEAANLLIQLSSEDSKEDRHNSCSSNSNSCSYSVVQGSGDVSSSWSASIEAVAEFEDEGFARKKRYRSIEELYSVTTPLLAKTMKRRK